MDWNYQPDSPSLLLYLHSSISDQGQQMSSPAIIPAFPTIRSVFLRKSRFLKFNNNSDCCLLVIKKKSKNDIPSSQL